MELDPIFGKPINLNPVAEAQAAQAQGPPPLKDQLGSKVESEVDALAAAAEAEKARQEKERQEKEEQERLEAQAREEKAEKERKEAEETARKEQEALEQKAAQERAEKERVEKERAEQERLEKERADQDRAVKEQAEKERAEKERVEQDRLEAQRQQEQRMEEERRAEAVKAKEAALRAEAESKAKLEAETGKPPVDPTSDTTSGSQGDESSKEVSLKQDENHERGANKPRHRKVPVAALLMLLLLLGAVAAVLVLGPKLWKKDVDPPTVQGGPNRELREQQYLESGWEADAREVLSRFLAADRPAGKAAYSIRGSELLEEMGEFYDGLKVDDTDTPMEAFAVFPLGMGDKKRGVFMLSYVQPPVFELNEFFVPLSPLRVQHGVEEPGLLLASVARRSNFTAEPLKVHAIFKRTPDGLRLDWETFVQTKYRTMRDFLELPTAGTSKIFRVIISETVPENRKVPAGHRTYMIADPAYPREDSARVDVAVDSDIGRALSILNWRGTEGGRAVAKTATLSLGWSKEETPQLQVEEFICWEFLGVGGDAVPGTR